MLFVYATPIFEDMNTNIHLTTTSTNHTSSVSFSNGNSVIQCRIDDFGSEVGFSFLISSDRGCTEYRFPIIKAMSVTGFVIKNGDNLSVLRDVLGTFATDREYRSYDKSDKVVTLAS